MIRLDIFSDPVCPWCLIGKRQLQRALAQLREALQGEGEPSLERLRVEIAPELVIGGSTA